MQSTEDSRPSGLSPGRVPPPFTGGRKRDGPTWPGLGVGKGPRRKAVSSWIMKTTLRTTAPSLEKHEAKLGKQPLSS